MYGIVYASVMVGPLSMVGQMVLTGQKTDSSCLRTTSSESDAFPFIY